MDMTQSKAVESDAIDELIAQLRYNASIRTAYAGPLEAEVMARDCATAADALERLRRADKLVREYFSALLLGRPEADERAAAATAAMVDYVMVPK